jgi:hypothetical protein
MVCEIQNVFVIWAIEACSYLKINLLNKYEKLDPQLWSVSQINLLEFDDEFCAIRIIWSNDGELENTWLL